eukprot:jgi/Chlat1/7916/Chrsp68S07354
MAAAAGVTGRWAVEGVVGRVTVAFGVSRRSARKTRGEAARLGCRSRSLPVGGLHPGSSSSRKQRSWLKTCAVISSPTEESATTTLEVEELPEPTTSGATLVTYEGEQLVAFRVWAPHADGVVVAVYNGAFNAETARRYPMQRCSQDTHSWYTHAPAEVGDSYHYLVYTHGRELHRRDPYARHTDYNSDACIITDTSYNWTPFERPAYDELILYELHIGSFTGYHDGDNPKGGGTFAAMEAKLDYIKSLGFNAIQLLPVHEFGGQWGYNPRLLMSVHGPFGTPAELRHLVDTCHQKGLAVIFDVVLNHGSSRLNSLWEWDGWGPNNNGGIYFEGSKDTPWGRMFCFFKTEVRQMITDSARMFLDEYNGDGLRFDSVHNMPWDLLQHLTYVLRHEFPGRVLISEITPETAAVIHNAGFDSTWAHAAFFDAIGFMRGDRDMDRLLSNIRLHSGFTKPHQCVKYFLGSHDQIGCRKNGGFDPDIESIGGKHRYAVEHYGGRDSWHARAQVRMWYGVMGVAAGMPMTFMGSECLSRGWWHIDEHHRFNWDFALDEHGRQMQACVAAMNKLRLSSHALRIGGVDFLMADRGTWVIVVQRKAFDETMVAVLNMSEGQWPKFKVPVAEGSAYEEVFNSQEAAFGGWEDSGNKKRGTIYAEHGKLPISLPKWAVLVFRKVQ